MQICDQVLEWVNTAANTPHKLNYLRNYIGLQSNGMVDNFVWLAPKPTKNIVHINLRNSNAVGWKDRLQTAGVPAQSKQLGRLRISVTPKEFDSNRDVIQEAIVESVRENNG
jgi:hypothetical protein